MQTNFERLSFLYSTFLVMGDPTNSMPVGAILIVEAGVSRREENGGVDIDTARALIGDGTIEAAIDELQKAAL